MNIPYMMDPIEWYNGECNKQYKLKKWLQQQYHLMLYYVLLVFVQLFLKMFNGFENKQYIFIISKYN